MMDDGGRPSCGGAVSCGFPPSVAVFIYGANRKFSSSSRPPSILHHPSPGFLPLAPCLTSSIIHHPSLHFGDHLGLGRSQTPPLFAFALDRRSFGIALVGTAPAAGRDNKLRGRAFYCRAVGTGDSLLVELPPTAGCLGREVWWRLKAMRAAGEPLHLLPGGG